MRSSTGSPVENEDFFDREQEQQVMWRKLESDSLLLLAPRRIGKTSLMWALCATAPAHGFQALKCSFAPCNDEMDCVQELIKAVSGVHSQFKRLQKSLQKRLSNLKSVKIGPFGIELDHDEQRHWREIGEALAATLTELDGNWLICVDEVPVFLINLLKREDGRERARGFLYWLRNLRQEHHRNIRWILAGSIGLDTVASRLGLGDTVNDLAPMPLGAFTPSTASCFLESLAASYDIPLDEATRHHIIDQLGWPVPYYIQVVFSKLLDIKRENEIPDNALVDQVFVELLSPAHKGYFDYWRQRLAEELGTLDANLAVHLLNHACRDPHGVQREILKQALSEHITELNTREEKLRYLLDILENDGYLVILDGRYQFQLELLRRYWETRVAL